jgi:hypothetical protein
MDCPVCDNPMITLELNEVEIDHCLDCGGIWLDAGELESLLDDAAKANQLLRSFQPRPQSAEKPRKCPICGKKMNKIAVGQTKQTLLIDKCPRNDGLWLDKGELQDIFERAELDADHKIRRLLADIFRRAQ